jgi:hypothetical protein
VRRSLAIFAALLLFGCDEKKSAPSAPKPPAPTGHGIIRGVVHFIGNPPVMPEIPNHPCHDGASSIHEETAVVSATGGLANVIVYLQDVPPGDGSANPPATLDQRDCHYIPHVLAVQINQPLIVRSSDPTMHNVHYSSDRNGAANFAETQVGASKAISFAEPELPIRIKCDVHPWMTAYVGVFPTPCFAVTDESGKFEISRIPAGTYTLCAWQEKYGTLSQKIVVSDNAAGEAAFDYKAP